MSPCKLHVTGEIRSVKVSSRDHLSEDKNKNQLTINMSDGNKVYLYTDHYGLMKFKKAIDQWWEENLNER